MVKTKTEIYTRCVGYLRPVDSMNDSKIAEVHDRHKFDKSVKILATQTKLETK